MKFPTSVLLLDSARATFEYITVYYLVFRVVWSLCLREMEKMTSELGSMDPRLNQVGDYWSVKVFSLRALFLALFLIPHSSRTWVMRLSLCSSCSLIASLHTTAIILL